GDFPPYQELLQPLQELILKTRFTSHFDAGLDFADVAIQVATYQAANLGNEKVVSHLEDEILEIARLVSGKASATKEVCAALLQAVISLAIGRREPAKIRECFAMLLGRVLAVCPEFRFVSAILVEKLREELPIDEAVGFWSVALKIRAS